MADGDEDFWNYVSAASSSEDEDYPSTRARLPLPPGSVLHPAFRSPLDLLDEAALAPNRSPAAPVLKTPSSVCPPPMARSVSAAPQLASATNLLAFPAAAAPAFYSAARLTQLASPATTTLSSPAATALTSPRAADPASTAAAQPRSDTSPALDSTGSSALPTPDSSGKSADPVRVFESLVAAAALRSAVPLATALHSPARTTPESAYTAVSSAQVSVISSAALISMQSPSAQVSKSAPVSVAAVPTAYVPVPAVPTAPVSVPAVPTANVPVPAVPATASVPVPAVPTANVPVPVVPIAPAPMPASPAATPAQAAPGSFCGGRHHGAVVQAGRLLDFSKFNKLFHSSRMEFSSESISHGNRAGKSWQTCTS
ncbi:uncharacterized protein LOC125798978 [Astyanax mexicanus]|uniref:uncharacterized protein LOC125798978 n=1 Tax=Astyanax mexicanus TaxID=7994 RepID=UPI0020CB57A8|nr:uncharacterized protein LOC125798978 [Astyanax mexicanus]